MEIIKNDKTIMIGIKFKKEKRDKLKNHLFQQGFMSLSEGIRKILIQYMKNEKL